MVVIEVFDFTLEVLVQMLYKDKIYVNVMRGMRAEGADNVRSKMPKTMKW